MFAEVKGSLLKSSWSLLNKGLQCVSLHDWITFLILEKSYKNSAIIIIIILCITAPKIVLWKFNSPKEVKINEQSI